MSETEMDRAKDEARRLALALAEKHYPGNEEWRPDDDLVGLILQISNMTSGLSRSRPAVVPEGWVLVPKEPTEAMIEAGCESDAYAIAVHMNKSSHEELMAKYPDLVKPKETHGAAPVQTLPIVWRAMISAAPPPPATDTEGAA